MPLVDPFRSNFFRFMQNLFFLGGGGNSPNNRLLPPPLELVLPWTILDPLLILGHSVDTHLQYSKVTVDSLTQHRRDLKT